MFWILIAIAVIATALAVLLAVNFKVPEKAVRHTIDHCHAIDDPQFELEMDAMLGPDMLQGNAITAL